MGNTVFWLYLTYCWIWCERNLRMGQTGYSPTQLLQYHCTAWCSGGCSSDLVDMTVLNLNLKMIFWFHYDLFLKCGYYSVLLLPELLDISPPHLFISTAFLCPLTALRAVILPESSQTDDNDEAQLYQSWFKLVLEKNRLARYESELMIL